MIWVGLNDLLAALEQRTKAASLTKGSCTAPDAWIALLLCNPAQHSAVQSTPAMVVVTFIAVHDLVGPVEGADEVVAGAFGAVEGIDTCDAAPDLVVRILIPGYVLVLPALTCRATLQVPSAMISSCLAEMNNLNLHLWIGWSGFHFLQYIGRI